MYFKNTIFKIAIKGLDDIDLKLLFWVKIIKKDLIMLVRLSIIFNALNVKNYFNINNNNILINSKKKKRDVFIKKMFTINNIHIKNTLKKKKN